MLISLPDNASGTGNSRCFKTEFNHITLGFTYFRISADRKLSLFYRSLNSWRSSIANKIHLHDTVLDLSFGISFGLLPRARKKGFLPMTHHLFSKLSFLLSLNPVR